jgi:hypothetical protein
VSVGRWFRNVNWVAIPGYKLFFQGDIKSGELLTETQFQATVQDAIDKEIYKGVDFHDYPDASDGGSLEDFITKHGIGTDLALNFARSAFCARLPITEPMLDEVIDFLNDKNREYAEGQADYNWSVWADNCAPYVTERFGRCQHLVTAVSAGCEVHSNVQSRVRCQVRPSSRIRSLVP